MPARTRENHQRPPHSSSGFRLRQNALSSNMFQMDYGCLSCSLLKNGLVDPRANSNHIVCSCTPGASIFRPKTSALMDGVGVTEENGGVSNVGLFGSSPQNDKMIPSRGLQQQKPVLTRTLTANHHTNPIGELLVPESRQRNRTSSISVENNGFALFESDKPDQKPVQPPTMNLPCDNLDFRWYVCLNLQNLGRLPNWVLTRHSLRVLHISNNALETLPSELTQLPCLLELIANNNRIFELPEELFSLPHLQKLHLRNNALGCISSRLGNLLELRDVDLAHNRLRSLPSMPWLYTTETHIRVFDGSYNLLTALPKRFELVNLTSLNLAFNQLQTFPSYLSKLSDLRSLDLRNNALESLPIPAINQLLNRQIAVRRRNRRSSCIPTPPAAPPHTPAPSSPLFRTGRPISTPPISLASPLLAHRPKISLVSPAPALAVPPGLPAGGAAAAAAAGLQNLRARGVDAPDERGFALECGGNPLLQEPPYEVCERGWAAVAEYLRGRPGGGGGGGGGDRGGGGGGRRPAAACEMTLAAFSERSAGKARARILQQLRGAGAAACGAERAAGMGGPLEPVGWGPEWEGGPRYRVVELEDEWMNPWMRELLLVPRAVFLFVWRVRRAPAAWELAALTAAAAALVAAVWHRRCTALPQCHARRLRCVTENS
jgi:hypothetical protein